MRLRSTSVGSSISRGKQRKMKALPLQKRRQLPELSPLKKHNKSKSPSSRDQLPGLPSNLSPKVAQPSVDRSHLGADAKLPKKKIIKVKGKKKRVIKQYLEPLTTQRTQESKIDGPSVIDLQDSLFHPTVDSTAKASPQPDMSLKMTATEPGESQLLESSIAQ